ncbi:MAG: hypothetical protein IPJ07_23520 [Acidobacteria bacterium]|nr:hypothetical protein [Acidobacteriota bacterium]
MRNRESSPAESPSLFYNTLNAAIDPTRGQSIFIGLSLAGGSWVETSTLSRRRLSTNFHPGLQAQD